MTAAQHAERGGPYLENFEVGDAFRSRIGRTVTETDNVWFTCLTMNTNQVHFNTPYARAGRYERPLVNSCFTLALITGLTVPHTSESAVANLGWSDVSLPRPVFVGDTLWAETEVLEVRRSDSNPSAGIVSVRSRGVNDRGEVVIEFRRAFMVPRRAAATPERLLFPTTDEAWRV
jgi:acyl dehydratase